MKLSVTLRRDKSMIHMVKRESNSKNKAVIPADTTWTISLNSSSEAREEVVAVIIFTLEVEAKEEVITASSKKK